MLWAAIKALFSCAAILIVIFLLGISRAPTMLLALPVLGPGRHHVRVDRPWSSTPLAKGYDFFTYYFTLVDHADDVPVRRVFSRSRRCRGWLQGVAQVLPLKAAVDLVRPLVLGKLAGRASAAVSSSSRRTRLAATIWPWC